MLSSSRRRPSWTRSVNPWPFLAVFFAAWILRVLMEQQLGVSADDYLQRRLWSDGWRVLLWLILPLFWLEVIERRSLSAALRPSKGQAPRLVPITVISLTIGHLCWLKLSTDSWHGIPADLPQSHYLAGVIGGLLVGLAEEFVFRGIFLSALIARRWPFAAANIIVALFFMLIHWPGWLLLGSGMSPVDLLFASLNILLFGLAMGGLVWLEGGLIAAILVHAAIDLSNGLGFS